jgi:hypothetical protein
VAHDAEGPQDTSHRTISPAPALDQHAAHCCLRISFGRIRYLALERPDETFGMHLDGATPPEPQARRTRHVRREARQCVALADDRPSDEEQGQEHREPEHQAQQNERNDTQCLRTLGCRLGLDRAQQGELSQVFALERSCEALGSSVRKGEGLFWILRTPDHAQASTRDGFGF